VKRRFTLLDQPYYNAARLVSELLTVKGMPACLVGGGAVQAWIASLRTGDGARRLSDAPLLVTTLRQTRDLDFATRADEATMLALLNELASTLGAGTHVLGPRAVRLGPVAVSFTLGPEDLSGMSARYDAFLVSRAPLHLRRSAELDELPTIGLEELVATTLTRRGDKAKDLVDLGNLAAALRDAGKRPDIERIAQLVDREDSAICLLNQLEAELRADT
jgi:hypothetical protein